MKKRPRKKLALSLAAFAVAAAIVLAAFHASEESGPDSYICITPQGWQEIPSGFPGLEVQGEQGNRTLIFRSEEATIVLPGSLCLEQTLK